MAQIKITKDAKEQIIDLTVEMLENQFGTDIGVAINYCEPLRMRYPETPKKPYLSKGADSNMAKQYANDLEQYEGEMITYREEKEKYNEHSNKIDSVLTEYVKEISGLNMLPEKYKAKVYSLAWSNGHSEGFYGIYNQLRDLVDIFQ